MIRLSNPFGISNPLLVLLVVVGLAFGAARPVAAVAKGGRPQVLVAGVCGKGATSNLRLRGGENGIELRFEIEHSRAGVVWRVALVHERRIAWRGSAMTTRPAGSFELSRTLPDLPGADEVTVRAVGPRGLVCAATAVLPES